MTVPPSPRVMRSLPHGRHLVVSTWRAVGFYRHTCHQLLQLLVGRGQLVRLQGRLALRFVACCSLAPHCSTWCQLASLNPSRSYGCRVGVAVRPGATVGVVLRRLPCRLPLPLGPASCSPARAWALLASLGPPYTVDGTSRGSSSFCGSTPRTATWAVDIASASLLALSRGARGAPTGAASATAPPFIRHAA